MFCKISLSTVGKIEAMINVNFCQHSKNIWCGHLQNLLDNPVSQLAGDKSFCTVLISAAGQNQAIKDLTLNKSSASS